MTPDQKLEALKLAPCPFSCGGNVSIVGVGAWNKCRAVYCESCEIYGPMMATDMAAAYAWNHRPSPAPTAPGEREHTWAIDEQGVCEYDQGYVCPCGARKVVMAEGDIRLSPQAKQPCSLTMHGIGCAAQAGGSCNCSLAALREQLAGVTRERDMLLAQFSKRQREHIQILTRPDIGWIVSAIELHRDGEYNTLRAALPASAAEGACPSCGGNIHSQPLPGCKRVVGPEGDE